MGEPRGTVVPSKVEDQWITAGATAIGKGGRKIRPLNPTNGTSIVSAKPWTDGFGASVGGHILSTDGAQIAGQTTGEVRMEGDQ